MNGTVENKASEAAEKTVLNLFLKTCRSLRDPRNKRSRVELVQVSAKWEMVFTGALEELERRETPELPALKEQVAA